MRRYLGLRGEFVPQVLRGGALEDALFWLARHLRAVRREGLEAWRDEAADHGALKDRCLHVLDELEGALPPEAADWARGVRRWLDTTPSRHLARLLAKALAFPSGASG